MLGSDDILQGLIRFSAVVLPQIPAEALTMLLMRPSQMGRRYLSPELSQQCLLNLLKIP